MTDQTLGLSDGSRIRAHQVVHDGVAARLCRARDWSTHPRSRRWWLPLRRSFGGRCTCEREVQRSSNKSANHQSRRVVRRVQDELVPPDDSCVRGTVHIAGFHVRPADDNPSHSVITYIFKSTPTHLSCKRPSQRASLTLLSLSLSLSLCGSVVTQLTLLAGYQAQSRTWSTTTSRFRSLVSERSSLEARATHQRPPLNKQHVYRTRSDTLLLLLSLRRCCRYCQCREPSCGITRIAI